MTRISGAGLILGTAIAAAWIALGSARAQNAQPAPAILFEKEILPILEANCVKCHAGSEPKSGLNVRTRGGLMKGGAGGPAIVPGSPSSSPLYQRVHSGQMPFGGPRLGEGELERIRLWIEQGAAAANPEALAGSGQPGTNPADRAHWAFQPPRRAPVPKVRNGARVRTPVDAFVLAELEKKTLSFSPEADRLTLLRRASFDLIGLPPAPREVDDFLADSSPDAYEKLIDRLLASPRYGERWGRHWLDVAGYADSEGGEAADLVRPNAWRYRDYVIRSFNSDKPYDRFLLEQLAGDELSDFRQYAKLPPDAVERLEATGFLRMAVDGSHEGHTQALNIDYLWKNLFDTQQIVFSGLLGLTMNCARCHDHKYEPISQKGYYRVQALFTGALRPDGPILVSAKRQVVQATPEEKASAEKVNAVQDPLAKALKDLQRARLGQYRAKHPKAEEATEEELRQMFPDYAEKADRLAAELKEEEAKRVELPTIRALYDVDATPPPTRVLRRGDFLGAREEEVKPGVPAVLDDPARPFQAAPPTGGAPTTGRRLAFARWLTSPDHPLTTRVMANRIWAHHFGDGIVPTLDNFGKSGDRPTNPQLLDWLATEFIRQGWSIKAIHRLLMTSTVYRQGSRRRPDALRVDPDNKLLWRMPVRRLDAEIVRDAMLAASGTLDQTMYGEPVPVETRPSGEIVPKDDAKGGRRSIYQLVRRSVPQTMLNVFGAPVMEVHCTRRSAYTSVAQALTLMNSEFVASQAEHFARRVLRESPPAANAAGPGGSKTVEYAFRQAVARKPTASERDLLLSFLDKQAARYPGMDAETLRLRVYSDLCHALLSSNEFIYVD